MGREMIRAMRSFQSYVCSRCAPKAVWLRFKHSPVQLESHESLEKSFHNEDTQRQQLFTDEQTNKNIRDIVKLRKEKLNITKADSQGQSRGKCRKINKQASKTSKHPFFCALFLCVWPKFHTTPNILLFFSTLFHRNAERNVEKQRGEWWWWWWGGAGVNEGKGRARRRRRRRGGGVTVPSNSP